MRLKNYTTIQFKQIITVYLLGLTYITLGASEVWLAAAVRGAAGGAVLRPEPAAAGELQPAPRVGGAGGARARRARPARAARRARHRHTRSLSQIRPRPAAGEPRN